MLQGHYIAKITENISVTVHHSVQIILSTPQEHLCFGNNVTCYMSAISNIA